MILEKSGDGRRAGPSPPPRGFSFSRGWPTVREAAPPSWRSVGRREVALGGLRLSGSGGVFRFSASSSATRVEDSVRLGV